MPDTPEPDPLDELLHAGPPPADDLLRERLWRRTRDRLRRRNWVRRAAVAAALAACYLAGFGTARLGTEAVPGPPVKRAPDQAASATVTVSPRDLEWQVLDSPRPRPDLARQAGDRYAAEEGDYQSALRCYRDALDAGSDRAIQPGDSWLLMVLKNAREKEESDAKPND